jgi:hypothetical protein
MTAAAPSARVDADPGSRPKRALRVLGSLAIAAVLAATFMLYLRPGLTLDLGQLMAFCGLR